MPEKRIERLDPALDRIIDTSETIHDLADGFHPSLTGPRSSSRRRRARRC